MIEFDFATTPEIVLRNHASHLLGEYVAERFKKRHAFVVTDAFLANSGLMDEALSSLTAQGIAYTIYDKVVADPPEEIVLDAIASAKAAQADCVIGFGGGSPMDAAKVVALMMTSTQKLQDIYGVGNVQTRRKVPLALIPTTAGTGSEVTPISILTIGATSKAGIVSPQLYADFALLDPALTVGLPASTTAATGIDAMVHAFEAYTTKHKKNAMSDMLARTALEKLYGNILRVCEKPDDLAARGEMIMGAMLAGQAFANAPVAAVHALAYPLGGIFHVPHGLSNSLVMPHVLRFNLSKAAPLYAELTTVIDKGFKGSTAQQADRFIELMERLGPDTKIPTRLSEVGVSATDIDRLSEDAMLQTRLLVNNPREVTSQDAKEIYKAAL